MTVKGKRVVHCHGSNKGKTISKHRSHKAAVRKHRAMQTNR